MAKFEWALQQMREGKKVARKQEDYEYYYLDIKIIRRRNDHFDPPHDYEATFTSRSLLAEDWELFTE